MTPVMTRRVDQLKEAFSSLKESFVEMILRFALAAEFHDPDTGTHLIRISDYSVNIAQGLGFSSQETDDLRYASCMHDIGKIAIPVNLLQKEDSLTEEEFSVMKRHPLIGARIFEGAKSSFLQMVYQITLFHHEKFDGTGYPFGFKGENIPLFARIVSLADVFDALTSKRPYRDPVDFGEAVEHIKKGSGSHFDPRVVIVFLKKIKDIETIWQANATINRFLEESQDKLVDI